jgi:hypothetical protein
MADTIKLPAIGEVKKGYVIAGVAIVAVIVAYAYFKHAVNASAASTASGSSTPTSSAPTSAVATSDIDPETGDPYGSLADQEALESLYGGSAVDTSDLGGGGVTTTSTGTVASASGTAITTNSAWLQNILDTNETGYTNAQVIAAISAWFAGVQITTSDLTVIQTCEAIYSAPPQPLPAPNVSTTGTGGTGGGSGSSGTGTTTKLAAPTGLEVTHKTATEVVVAWRPVSGASSYTFQITPKDASPHSIGNRTSYNVGGLKKNTSYVAHVAASGGPTASVSFKTS